MMRAAFSIVARDFLGLNMGAEPGRARAVDDAGRAVGMMFKLSAELHRLPGASKSLLLLVPASGSKQESAGAARRALALAYGPFSGG